MQFIYEYKFSDVHLVKQNLFTCSKSMNIKDTFQDYRLYFCRFLFLTLLQTYGGNDDSDRNIWVLGVTEVSVRVGYDTSSVGD
jgi:hypothetical protein